ncbi:MAG: cob(I)yrinic acid a,c-diamide adenosyltransferase [Bacteroidales bacterium]|nr:cob(I)yrinic acid a,c-diamide adenosyltransferase [Bacteroidales bacterium]
MMKNTVYTHTGDKGTTGLIGGTRIAKSDKQLEAYGSVDELNSFVGLLYTYIINDHDKGVLFTIQNKLHQVCSCLATDYSSAGLSRIKKLTSENVKSMEHEIDVINAQLPLLNSFILPGGCRAAAVAHICRTVCRRAERRIYSFRDEQHPVDHELLEYMNRLSDYFFVLSRKVNIENKTDEILWDNSCI